MKAKARMTSKPVLKALLGNLVAVLLLAGGCGATHGSSESETHFLGFCQDECGAGLDCICGICTKACDSVDPCLKLAAQATCDISSAGVCADEPVSVCDVKCTSDVECDELGSGYACEAGACRWGTELTASDGDGSDGPDTGTEGTGTGGTGTGGTGTGGTGTGGTGTGAGTGGAEVGTEAGDDTSRATLAETTDEYPACSSSVPDDFIDLVIPELVRPPTCDETLALGATSVYVAPPAAELPRSSSVVEDWNGDGHLDLATATPAGVSVLLGGGDGTLGSRIDSPMTLGDPGQLEIGDLNHDGRLDLVMTGYGYNTVNVLFGDGSGAFSCGATYKTGALPVASAIHDFSGDGLDDLAVLNQNDGTVQVLLGNADGILRKGVSFSAGLTPSSITAGDFDDDQITDLAVANLNDQSLSVFTGTSDGRFQRGSTFATGHLPHVAVSADVSADGYLDLVVSNGCTPSDLPSISVLLGTGYGFTQPDVYPTANCVAGVSVGDVNGDGSVDLLGPDGPLIGNGDGTFSSENLQLSSGDSLGLFDWNQDDKLDVAQLFDYTVRIELGNGDGTFGTLLKSEVSVDSGAVEAFTLADLNGDGTLDSAFNEADKVVIALGAGDGTFDVEGQYAVGQRPTDIGAVDLNGDDRIDLVTANWDSSTVSVLLAAAAGGYTTTEYSVGESPSGLAMGDLNADEIPDLVVSNSESASLSVLLGTGDGTFAPEETHPVPDFPRAVLLRDVNEDGVLDAVQWHGTREPSILFGTGDGSFTASASLGASRGSVLAVEDLNADAHLDLVMLVDDVVTVELGRGDGSFEASIPAYTKPPGWGDVGDVDGDGNLDLLLGDTILRGAGDGTFRCAERHSMRDGRFGDVDGDGLLDVVSMTGPTITVALHGIE